MCEKRILRSRTVRRMFGVVTRWSNISFQGTRYQNTKVPRYHFKVQVYRVLQQSFLTGSRYIASTRFSRIMYSSFHICLTHKKELSNATQLFYSGRILGKKSGQIQANSRASARAPLAHHFVMNWQCLLKYKACFDIS